jgi:hypothetical protein
VSEPRGDTPVEEDIKEENRRIRRLRLIVDLALHYIRTSNLTHDQALRIVSEVRRHTLTLFPGKEDAFDIIYAPRFKRVLNEKFKRS